MKMNNELEKVRKLALGTLVYIQRSPIFRVPEKNAERSGCPFSQNFVMNKSKTALKIVFQRASHLELRTRCRSKLSKMQ